MIVKRNFSLFSFLFLIFSSRKSRSSGSSIGSDHELVRATNFDDETIAIPGQQQQTGLTYSHQRNGPQHLQRSNSNITGRTAGHFSPVVQNPMPAVPAKSREVASGHPQFLSRSGSGSSLSSSRKFKGLMEFARHQQQKQILQQQQAAIEQEQTDEKTILAGDAHLAHMAGKTMVHGFNEYQQPKQRKELSLTALINEKKATSSSRGGKSLTQLFIPPIGLHPDVMDDGNLQYVKESGSVLEIVANGPDVYKDQYSNIYQKVDGERAVQIREGRHPPKQSLTAQIGSSSGKKSLTQSLVASGSTRGRMSLTAKLNTPPEGAQKEVMDDGNIQYTSKSGSILEVVPSTGQNVYKDRNDNIYQKEGSKAVAVNQHSRQSLTSQDNVPPLPVRKKTSLGQMLTKMTIGGGTSMTAKLNNPPVGAEREVMDDGNIQYTSKSGSILEVVPSTGQNIYKDHKDNIYRREDGRAVQIREGRPLTRASLTEQFSSSSVGKKSLSQNIGEHENKRGTLKSSFDVSRFSKKKSPSFLIHHGDKELTHIPEGMPYKVKHSMIENEQQFSDDEEENQNTRYYY